MTLVGRFLLARKRAMSAMMPPLFLHIADIYVQGKDTKIISVEVVVNVLLTVTSKGTVQISVLRNGNLDMFRVCYVLN